MPSHPIPASWLTVGVLLQHKLLAAAFIVALHGGHAAAHGAWLCPPHAALTGSALSPGAALAGYLFPGSSSRVREARKGVIIGKMSNVAEERGRGRLPHSGHENIGGGMVCVCVCVRLYNGHTRMPYFEGL